jgi:hypothetical protein
MYTQKKPIDNTHIVRERDRRRNRELLAVLSLGVPIGLFLLLFAWQNLEVIRLGRETTRLQKIYKDTEAAHKALEAERDRLTSFDTVETQAAKLGFAAADPKTIVMVTSEKSSSVPRGSSEVLGAVPPPRNAEEPRNSEEPAPSSGVR